MGTVRDEFAEEREQFAANVAGFEYDTADGRKVIGPHRMTILHDFGAYRHLRFASPDGDNFRFDLLTAPRMLLFRGAGETYVFGGAEDMLALFRQGGREGVDPYYWSTKVAGGKDAVRQYSRDRFEQHVKEYTARAIRERLAPRGIGKAVAALLDDGWTEEEACARRALEEFEFGAYYRVECSCGASDRLDDHGSLFLWQSRHRGGDHRVSERRVDGFVFADSWEWDLREFHHWFAWACFAISWGIARYDEARKAVTVP